MKIKNAALIGMGAVGTVYGKLLHDKYGENFAAIAGGTRGDKMKNNGITLNNSTFFPRIISPDEGDFKAGLIIICVKNNQLNEAIADIHKYVGKETVILPLLNGVTARDRIHAVYSENKVLYGLSIAIDALRTNECVTNTVNGTIQFGDERNMEPSQEVTATQKYLTDAGIDAQICDDMIRTIWRKWMLNIGCNQISAITGALYGELMSIETNCILIHEAMMEVLALAMCSGIDLKENDIMGLENLMRNFSPNSKTSMLQDIEAKRQTEVDYFAGTVIEFGKKLNVPTPVNNVLYCIIKSKEQLYR